MSPVRRGPVRPAEVEGYLTGVEHRLAAHHAAGRPVEAAEALIGEAKTAIARRDWALADNRLREADARLDDVTPQRELTEWPRGLTSYRSDGPRGEPPDREEEGVSNRLLLAQKLLAVRRAQGRSVEDLVPRLRDAEAAYQGGDRRRARAIVDEVQRELDTRLA